MTLRAVSLLALVLAAGMAVPLVAAPDAKPPKHHEKVDKRPHKEKAHHEKPRHDHHPAPAPDSGRDGWGTYPH